MWTWSWDAPNAVSSSVLCCEDVHVMRPRQAFAILLGDDTQFIWVKSRIAHCLEEVVNLVEFSQQQKLTLSSVEILKHDCKGLTLLSLKGSGGRSVFPPLESGLALVTSLCSIEFCGSGI